MDKDIAIYSFKVSRSLVRRGFKLNNMEPNSKVKGRIVFYFENSPDIRDALKKNYGINIK